jgi:hypothetical protein
MSVANTDPRAILTALVSAMQGIDGTGGYHYDTSSSVVIGSPAEPPQTWPTCYVEPGAMVPDLGPAGRVPLGQYRCTFGFRLYLFVPVSSTGGTESQLEAYDAMMDLFRAATTDRSIGGTVHLSRFVGDGVTVGTDADALGTGRAVAIVSGEVEWTRSLS